jgi:hypothetical protein
MIWIFALGVLGFAIYHPGFRKVCFWIGGISGIAVFAIILDSHVEDQRRQTEMTQSMSKYERSLACDMKPFDALKYSECMAKND